MISGGERGEERGSVTLTEQPDVTETEEEKTQRRLRGSKGDTVEPGHVREEEEELQRYESCRAARLIE